MVFDWYYRMMKYTKRYGRASLDHIYRLCVTKTEKPVVQPPDLDGEECAHIRAEVGGDDPCAALVTPLPLIDRRPILGPSWAPNKK